MAALEMLQWIKSYFDHNFLGGDYDGSKRRSEAGIRDPGDTSRKAQARANRTANTSRGAPPQSTVKPRITTRMPAETPRAQSAQLIRIREQLEEMKRDNQTLTEERNFYYNKLQRVEELCQSRPGDAFAEQVLGVLYETDEDHGFVSPDELDI
jgi:RP/EB family microtubule-associated protein